MANTDNICSGLEILDLFKDSKDTLGDILELQRDTQTKIYNYDFDTMSLNDIKNFWLMNKHAEGDEDHEMFDALGGINDGIGNAVWKPWKKDHPKASQMKLSDLTENDKKELVMEFVDKLHFFMNYAVSLGLDSKTIYNYYMAKNVENRNRQKRSY